MQVVFMQPCPESRLLCPSRTRQAATFHTAYQNPASPSVCFSRSSMSPPCGVHPILSLFRSETAAEMLVNVSGLTGTPVFRGSTGPAGRRKQPAPRLDVFPDA